MKIYIDLCLIINFFFDFLLLFGTSKILKRKVSLKRLLLGSFTASLTILMLFIRLNNFSLFILKLLLSILIILVTFGKNNLKENLIYFYILSITLGGTLYLLDITTTYNQTNLLIVKNKYSLNIIVILITTPIIIYLYIKEHLSYKLKISAKYNVILTINRKKYELEATLDTGNNLKDPYKKRSIILIDKNINIKNNKVIYVPYKALNTEGVIPCILPEKVIINNNEYKNILIGLSKDKLSINGTSCILPNSLKEDLCID